MAELTALQSVPGGQIGSGTAQVFNPMQGVQILANARQRQDQIDWHNKQAELARQKAIADARQKAEEDEVVASYKENKGEIFAKYGKEVRDSLIETGRQNWSKFKKPEKQQFIADVDDVTGGINVWSLGQDEKLKQWRANPDSKYFNVPSSLVEQEADAFARSKPDFYKRDFVSELDKKVRNNPALYNWDAAGDDLMKEVKTFDGEIKNASGTGSKVKFSQIYQSRKNPKTGVLEPILDPATGLPLIDKKVVMDKIESSPTIRAMTNNFIAQALPELQQRFPNMKTDELLKAAEGEAINRMFKTRGVYDVTKDLQPTETEARLRAQGTKLADIEEVDTPVKLNYAYKTKEGQERIVPVNLGMGRSVRLKQPAEIGSNRRAYILAGDLTKTGFDDLLSKQADGSYILNFGFKTKEFQKVKDVLQLTQDTKFRNKDGKIETKEKGAIITPMEAEGLRKIGQGNHFKKVNGFRLSPGTFQVDEETEKRVGPIFQGLDIFIPGGTGEVPELENVNPRKKAVSETDEIDIGFD